MVELGHGLSRRSPSFPALGGFFVNQSLSKAKGVHGIISLIVLADVFPGEDLVFEPPHRAWR